MPKAAEPPESPHFPSSAHEALALRGALALELINTGSTNYRVLGSSGFPIGIDPLNA